jgi:hypothetical protein
MKEAYTHEHSPPDKLLLSKPVDLDFELLCLERYWDLIEFFKLHFFKTPLEQDLEVLRTNQTAEGNPLSSEARSLVVFRIQNKKIL